MGDDKMKIEIILKEQLNECGDEYLDEKDVNVSFVELINDSCMGIKVYNRFFIVDKNDILQLAKLCGK